MKHISRFIIAFCIIFIPASAKAKSPTVFDRNHLYIGVSPMDYNCESVTIITGELGYAYDLTKNLQVGLIWNHGLLNLEWFDDNDCREADKIGLISAMVYYRGRVMRDWLYFRVGGGIGGSYGYKHTYPLTPYFTVQSHWVVKIKNSPEIYLAPLIISPSRYSVSLRKFDSCDHGRPYKFNSLNIGLGWQF